jgi:hypothetical protein
MFRQIRNFPEQEIVRNRMTNARNSYLKKTIRLLKDIVETYRSNNTINLNDFLIRMGNVINRVLMQVIQYRIILRQNMLLNEKIERIETFLKELKQVMILLYQQQLHIQLQHANTYTRRNSMRIVNVVKTRIDNTLFKGIYISILERVRIEFPQFDLRLYYESRNN